MILSFYNKKALKKHENVCKDRDYCYVEMPVKSNNILKHNPGERCIRVPFIIYSDLESLLENISICHNNPNKSSTIKINKHTPSGYSLFTHCSFDTTKNSKPDCYRGEDCMENFCKTLKKHAERINYCEKKEMIPLTDEENKFYENKKCYYICKKRFTKDNKKERDHCHFTRKYKGAAHNNCNTNY